MGPARKKGEPAYTAETLVHIIGSNKLQNELLAIYLEEQLKLSCQVPPHFGLPLETEQGAGQIHLILFDCMDTSPDSLWEQVEKADRESRSLFFVALFNADTSEEFTRKAMARRARGVFYRNTSPKAMLKGLLAILDGELWYSREALSQFLIEPRSQGMLPENADADLTVREKEILTRIADGASNKEIADSLFISLHTVKSHIYNIYKKIGVTNRLKAAQWVTKQQKNY
jgi:DNA-binding NarL/FixJ family response regulator